MHQRSVVEPLPLADRLLPYLPHHHQQWRQPDRFVDGGYQLVKFNIRHIAKFV